MTRVRFAPALTGNLLVNSLRVALANDLFARRTNGRMLLRFDDIGREHSPAASGDQIMLDLRWFGIEWHTSFRQSDRLELYREAIEQLKRDKFLYPCFESAEELKAKEEFRRKRNQPLIYDRAMLALTEKQRADAEAGGKRPHWRFKLSGRTLEWRDLIGGTRRVALSAVSDPVLVRADGRPTPVLASVVDDIEFGTTDIIRGEESASSTAVQIELFEVLRGSNDPIRFAHLPALDDGDAATRGGRGSGSLSLRTLRKDGVEPSAIATCMTGVALPGGAAAPLERLADQCELRDLAACRFDMARLLEINRGLLADLGYAAVADRLPGGATEAFWLAVRGSLDLLKETRGWWDVVAGTIVPPVVEGERDLLLTACALLPPEPWDNDVWTNWVEALERNTDRSGDMLLEPLRLALTGEDSGPDLANLLPLIGRSRAVSRLAIAAA